MNSNYTLKQKAIELRKKGKTYTDIITILKSGSKSTLHYWFKNLNLSEKSTALLEKNKERARQKSIANFNTKRRLLINLENKKILEANQSRIGTINSRELLLISTALYWGEGTKNADLKSGQRLTFTNSDPKMIQVYMRFLREILRVDEKRIRAGIHLYQNTNILSAKKFWSGITKLPISEFYIIKQKNQNSGLARKKHKVLAFGTLVIKINSRKMFFTMKGMIDGVIMQAAK